MGDNVLGVFGSLKKVLKLDQVAIDNNVFRLHYKVTVLTMLACSLLVTSKQFFGDPIDCISKDDVPNQVLDTFCWIHATFTLPKAFKSKVGKEVVAPGVDKHLPGDQKIYHKYYQWVCLVLFLQAMSFYVPRYLWKMWEGGRMRNLVLNLHIPILEDEQKKSSVKVLATYLRQHIRLHNVYFYRFVFCEVLNFLNVIIQLYVMDLFFGGAFSTFGLEVLKFSETETEWRTDPMVLVFPRMTKCTFHRFSSDGSVMKYDALCILPLNIINEKIYIFLWFWLLIVALLTGVTIVYRIAMIFLPNIRYMVLRSRARLTDRYHLQIVTDVSKIGDWFVFYLLAKNMDPLNYRELMQELAKEVTEEGKSFIEREKEP
ncbi:Innexin inx2-like protein [Leptotrombidium deliense]|uniref:Innexin n=1 Tax=Leptotrombidium deliense TaxID=299467 RepID=A0A443S6K1_9ACAR|nr:Innexin inx2-like protein [Leptotrombidium deliense]